MASGRALEAEISSALGGDREPLDSRLGKKGKTAAEYVAGLSSEKRKRLRAKLEALLIALDEAEANESEEPDEEEEL